MNPLDHLQILILIHAMICNTQILISNIDKYLGQIVCELGSSCAICVPVLSIQKFDLKDINLWAAH